MRELRVQHAGRPYRLLYAFDPLRTAILLIGGDKKGHERWYEIYVPIADRLYDEHVQQLRHEGRIPMAKKFKDLQAKMAPEARARSEAKAQRMIQEMALNELRAARALTQEHLSTLLGVKQSAVSKLERRADMYVSTLRQFIQAMGGVLEIRAVFPDRDVRITQFHSLTVDGSRRCVGEEVSS
jgi:hypothetical protein